MPKRIDTVAELKLKAANHEGFECFVQGKTGNRERYSLHYCTTTETFSVTDDSDELIHGFISFDDLKKETAIIDALVSGELYEYGWC